MIQRLVKFTIKNGRESDFLDLCKESKIEFDSFLENGCIESKFWQDTRVPTIFFALTVWKNQESVDSYHHSPHSADFWKKVIDVCALSPEVFVLKNI